MVRWLLVSISCMSCVASGCASLQGDAPTTGQQLTDSQQQAAVEAFESRRDQAQLDAATARLSEGDSRGARELLEQLVHRNGQHRQARVLLAELELTAGRPQLAREHVATALAAHPHDARLVHLMGLALEATGQHAEAAEHFQRAADLEPEAEIFRLSVATAAHASGGETTPPAEPHPAMDANVAQASYTSPVQVLDERIAGSRAGATDTAAPIGTPADQADREVSAVAAAALAELRVGRPEQALQRLQPALARHPESTRLLQIAAVSHYRAGRYDASQVALRQALSLDNQNALSYFLMGETLSRLGDSAGADWHHRRGAELSQPAMASP